MTSFNLLPLFERLRREYRNNPDRPAILSPDTKAISYRELFETTKAVTASLRANGIEPQDRVAIVLPNGPELAVSIVAVAGAAVCVPLSIKLSNDDWHRHLHELRIDALLTISGAAPAAVRAASDLHLTILEARSFEQLQLGTIAFAGSARSASQNTMAEIGDDAFVLPTSGTTAWPKSVPLTHANICHSMRNTGASLELSEKDVLLCPLPLHHAHGLISGLMATIGAGAGILVMRSFSAAEFFQLLDQHKPTWYTAVPTIHQAIAIAVDEHESVIRNHSLRFIRSASASLPTTVYSRLSHFFGVPILETYGMTEAASQIASNPLPPGIQKAGSVGIATGQEVAVVGSDWAPLPIGQKGEIALRGPNLTRGYEDVVAAPGDQWKDGWFRTGDLGFIDDDGYIFIRGRIKEVINRGGEKIVPMKVEEALLAHDQLLEAVAFSVPHERLGEEVAAVVVLRPGSCLSEKNLRMFTLENGSLRHSEVPKVLIFVDAIPKNNNGKVQRNGMATLFGLTGNGSKVSPRTDERSVPPQTALETQISKIWCEELGIDNIGRNDDFFLLGGDSLTAVRLSLRVLDEFDLHISLRQVFEAPTVGDLAKMIEEKKSAINPARDLAADEESTVERESQCTRAQIGILDCERRYSGLPIYNMPFSFRLHGPLDVSALERSLQSLVKRHQSLRTIYSFNDAGYHSQVVPNASLELEAEDWSVISPSDRTQFARSIADDEFWKPIDLQSAPVFRARLLKLSKDDHVLMFTFHHINSDGWSMRMFFQELSYLYQGFLGEKQAKLRQPKRQFPDFARSQQKWLESERARGTSCYWRKRLNDPVSIFRNTSDARTDSPGFGTARVPIDLPSGLVEKLEKFAQEERCTLFMVLLSGWTATLRLCFEINDVSIATPMANRTQRHSEGIFGLIENLVVVRTREAPDISFKCLVSSVREAVLDAHINQELPIEHLIESLTEEERQSFAPTLDICFSLRSCFSQAFNIPSLHVTSFDDGDLQGQPFLPVHGTKLMLTLVETPSGIKGSCIYRESLFDKPVIKELLVRFEKVLWQTIFEPEQSISSIAERLFTTECKS